MGAQSAYRTVAAIAAVARNGVIGIDGGLPWRLSDDLKFFKRQTLGKPVIMGRKTFESIGKALPGRANIVVTRDATFAVPNILTTTSPSNALALASTESPDASEIMVIGGGQMYLAMLPDTRRLYLTEVDANVDGDTRFPELDRSEWIEIWSERRAARDTAPGHRFVILERRV